MITKIAQKGFTLLEMLVVLSISTIIIGIVLFNYRDADSSLIMRNLAYEVSLTIRQAQTYGLGVRDSGVGNNAFDVAYGVQFAGPGSGADANDTFYLFADIYNNGANRARLCNQADSDNPCTSQAAEEVLEALSLTRQITFSSIVGNSTTSNPVPLRSDQYLNITFKRPNPDATINLNGEDMNDVTITLIGPNGSKVDVYVNTAGQISVQKNEDENEE